MIKKRYVLDESDYKEWLRSMEDVAYHIAYYGESPNTHRLIVETVVRLSEEVATFVYDRCCFVSVGDGAYGLILPGRVGVHPIEKRSRNMWIIVLEDNMSAQDAQSIIAHEIACAWLEHNRLGICATTIARFSMFAGQGMGLHGEGRRILCFTGKITDLVTSHMKPHVMQFAGSRVEEPVKGKKD